MFALRCTLSADSNFFLKDRARVVCPASRVIVENYFGLDFKDWAKGTKSAQLKLLLTRLCRGSSRQGSLSSGF